LTRFAASMLVASLAALAACTPPTGPAPIVPKAGEAAPPVVRRPAPPQPEAPAAEAPVAIPAGAVYACVVGVGARRTVTAIEFAPKVATLCAKHPEMGPCQYEREGCRRNGGRVFAADGSEITAATEAEYDKKVIRKRFRAD
jgi:hypothetical protein